MKGYGVRIKTGLIPEFFKKKEDIKPYMDMFYFKGGSVCSYDIVEVEMKKIPNEQGGK